MRKEYEYKADDCEGPADFPDGRSSDRLFCLQGENIVFNSAQEEPPQTNLTFFGFKYEAL